MSLLLICCSLSLPTTTRAVAVGSGGRLLSLCGRLQDAACCNGTSSCISRSHTATRPSLATDRSCVCPGAYDDDGGGGAKMTAAAAAARPPTHNSQQHAPPPTCSYPRRSSTTTHRTFLSQCKPTTAAVWLLSTLDLHFALNTPPSMQNNNTDPSSVPAARCFSWPQPALPVAKQHTLCATESTCCGARGCFGSQMHSVVDCSWDECTTAVTIRGGYGTRWGVLFVPLHMITGGLQLSTTPVCHPQQPRAGQQHDQPAQCGRA